MGSYIEGYYYYQNILFNYFSETRGNGGEKPLFPLPKLKKIMGRIISIDYNAVDEALKQGLSIRKTCELLSREGVHISVGMLHKYIKQNPRLVNSTNSKLVNSTNSKLVNSTNSKLVNSTNSKLVNSTKIPRLKYSSGYEVVGLALMMHPELKGRRFNTIGDIPKDINAMFIYDWSKGRCFNRYDDEYKDRNTSHVTDFYYSKTLI